MKQSNALRTSDDSESSSTWLRDAVDDVDEAAAVSCVVDEEGALAAAVAVVVLVDTVADVVIENVFVVAVDVDAVDEDVDDDDDDGSARVSVGDGAFVSDENKRNIYAEKKHTQNGSRRASAESRTDRRRAGAAAADARAAP